MSSKSKRYAIFTGLVLLVATVLITSIAFAQGRGGRLREMRQRRTQNDPKKANLQDIIVNGVKRQYALHLPKNFRRGQKLPLVLAFHGGGGNAQNMINMTGFNQKADKEKFIVAYPNGSGRRNDNILLTWNASGCCSYAAEENIDDVGFVSALIDKLVAEHGVDRDRVYATGFSNGAMISFRLGLELPDKIAAIAPVSGAMFKSSPTSRGKVAVLMINGTGDKAVPYEGGFSENKPVNNAQSEEYKPVKNTFDLWKTNNNCRSKLETSRKGDLLIESYTNCSGNNDVQLYTINNGGHSWPGGKKGRRAAEEPSDLINASDVIWDFFKSHKKQR